MLVNYLSVVSLVAATFSEAVNALPQIQTRGRVGGHSFAESCPPITGDFNVSIKGLDPENLDFDSIHCKVYFSDLFNASATVYDVYTKAHESITFPDITGDPDYHVSGVDFDVRTGAVYFAADSGAPFNTGGKNLTGPNQLIKYDTYTNTTVYIVDMAPIVAEIKNLTGFQVSGFQDMAEDEVGNTYFIATFGSAIVKVSPTGDPSIFYNSSNVVIINGTTQAGWGGIFSVANTLVLVDDGDLVTFDTTVSPAAPNFHAPLNMPAGRNLTCDGFYAPPMFDGTIALCSDDSFNGTGGITVLESKDNWQSGTYLGTVVNDVAESLGGTPTATVQMADSLYISEEFFTDINETRTEFPFVDITARVKALCSRAGISS